MVLPLAASLVPLPSSVTREPGTFPLTARTRIVIEGDADAAASALIDAISERTGLTLSVVHDASGAGDITLRLRDGAPAEAYTLTVGESVEATGDAAGLFYAVQTLRQLVTADGDEWHLPRVAIEDAPRFAYRGVMLDVARTFFPVDVIKGYIDRAASLKFNRVHLHLTDDQGWRVQIDSRPLLTERASSTSVRGRPGGFYSKDDYREIVRYAAERRIVIVPEVDLPGHTHAIGLAYPEFVEAPVITDAFKAQAAELGEEIPVLGEPYQGWGVGHSSVKIHEEGTYEFLRDVLGELADLTPGPYLHIGGDEALGTPQADFDLFIERITALTAELGKTPVAWHEAGSAQVAEGTIGQYWGNTSPQGTHAEEARRFAERGGAVILSPSNTAYLDQKYDADFPLGISWAGLIDLETAYGWEPTEIIPGLPDAAILGIEGPLWAETLVTADDIDQLFFPRAAALAEIAWSPVDGAERSWESFRRRVGELAPAWDAAGWGGHRPAEIPWSTR